MFLTKQLRLALMVLSLIAAQAGAALGNDVTITGEVTYRDRIALPDDVQLWVTLVTLPDNVSIAAAAAEVASGGQVPLAFTLHVRSDGLKPDGVYGLKAEIRNAAGRLFRSGMPTPVDLAAPSGVQILVSYAPQAIAPVDERPPTPAVALPLLDTTWSVTSIGGDPVLPGAGLTLTISSDWRAGGHAGCNSYFAEAAIEADKLAFGPVAGTRMACAPEIMAQETRFFAALAATVGYWLDGDALQLRDAAGVTLAGLIRAP